MKKSACLFLLIMVVIGHHNLYSQVPCSTVATWSSAQAYPNTGTQVVYNSNLYRSKWWANTTDIPGNTNGPWEFLGNCQSGTSAPLPTSFSVSGWANSGTAIYTINSGNVGIGNSNPSQKLDVFGNIQITGAGNALRFADGTQLSSATTAGLWVAKGDTAFYNKSVNIGGILKIGRNSLYAYSYTNPSRIGSINEFYADNGPLIIQNTNPSLRVLIGTMDNSNLAGLNSYSQNTKVLTNGHISLVGWDNGTNTTLDNWFRTDKMVMQNIQDLDANHWNRGLVSNNLIWDSGLNAYSVLNNTNGQNDFSAIRFDNFGSLSFYTAPQNGNYSSISTTVLETYNRLSMGNNGTISMGPKINGSSAMNIDANGKVNINGSFNGAANFSVYSDVDPLLRVSTKLSSGNLAHAQIAVAQRNAAYNSRATPGDVIIGAACGGSEDLILYTSNSGNGSIRFTTNGGQGCSSAPDLERMTILGDGKIGINNIAPSTQLDVIGNGLFQGTLSVTGAICIGSVTPKTGVKLHIKGSGQSDASIFLEPKTWTNGATGQINFGDQFHYILSGFSSGMQFFDFNNFNFATNGTANAMYIAGNGAVGIGTNAPANTLHVIGNQNGSVGVTSALFGGQNVGNTFLSMGTSAASNGYSYIRSAKSHTISWGDLVLNEYGGNVGVGTTTIPTGYRMAVDGKIFCRGLKVLVSGFPDYVFDEKYKLPTIEDVERNIVNNKRLIGMPSESEVTANGMEVENIQIKTIEKVEELTLYIIQLNNKIKELEVKLMNHK